MNFSSPSNCWTIINAVEASIKAKIAEHGKKLSEWNISIYRGILTGYNEAFIIDSQKKEELILEDPKSAEIIRPILRGRDVDRYKYNFAGQYLINVHNGIKNTCTLPINIEKYPAIKNHLNRWLETLKDRQDQGVTPYNLRNCAYMDDFSKPKIVWARLMRIHKSEKRTFPRFCLVPEDMFVVDSLCFFTGSDLKYIVAFLNSSVAAYYFLKNIAILDDGGMQMRQQFVEDIPVPVIDERCKVFEDIITLYDYIKQQPDTVDTTCVERKIDQLFYDMLGLTKEEISMIELELQELESIK